MCERQTHMDEILRGPDAKALASAAHLTAYVRGPFNVVALGPEL